MMEGTDNNNCLPSDLWMSQIDPQYSGNLGNPSLDDTRSMSSPTQLDLSRKQPPIYNSSYDVSGVNYKQNVQAMTTPAMQPFASSSTRSAWEFAAQNFSPSPKNFTTQNLSQAVCSTNSRYSQPVSDYMMHNIVQSHSKPQPLRNFPPENVSQSLDFTSQNIPQTVQEMTSQNMTQPGTTDRSVWSQFYSMDPSLAPYSINSNVSQKPSYPQEKPFAYTQPSSREQPTLDRSSILSEKPPLILGKLGSCDSVATSYMNVSSVPTENVSTSNFAPSIYSNVLGPSYATKQIQSMDYEQLGGYSPVSPPTHDSSSSPFPVPTSSQDADLVLKHDNHEITSKSISGLSSDSNNSALPVSQVIHSDPSMLPVSFDVPLDMTKAWSSQDTTSTASVTSNYDVQVSQSAVQSTQANFMSKDTVKQNTPVNQSSDFPLNLFINLSQKIAPKKSNFYGRDASYFSVPDESPQSSHLSEKEMTDNNNGVKTDSLSKQINPVVNVPRITCKNSQPQMTAVITSESAMSSNFDSTKISFADSLLEANPVQCTSNADNIVSTIEETQILQNTKENTDVLVQNMETDEENIPLSQVSAEMKQKQGHSAECFDLSIQKDQVDNLSENAFSAKDEIVENLEQEPFNFQNVPNTTNLRGKATRGRKKRGAGAQKRQGRKAAAQMQTLIINTNESEKASGVDSLATDDNKLENNVSDLNIDTGNTLSIQTVPKAKPTRGRKRKIQSMDATIDSDTSMPRRSSNRRSKDNAMRLIELQAESIYSHVTKTAPPEPQQPARARRKAAKAAIESNFDESKHDEDIEEKNSSSDELSDEKDVDYAVDEDDVEALAKDEMLDMEQNKKKATAEKRVGGLKMSIKLGVDSSAAIVSGIDEVPTRKKRKVVKKKVGKSKFKSKAIIKDDDIEDDLKEIDEKKSESAESVASKVESEETNVDTDIKSDVEGKPDIVGRHNSLMDKYFLSANSATLARQVQKPQSVKKESKVKQEGSNKSKTVKNAKGSNSKVVTNSLTAKQLSSQSNLDDDQAAPGDTTSDTGLPKFVCGYCPNRYHNKQALLSHMEAHMAEMEDNVEKATGSNVSKEPKKPAAVTPKKNDSGPAKHPLPKTGKKVEASEELKFNCGECGKTFSSKLNLLDHIRTHTAEKPFECNLCHKCFKERDQLSVHRKVHAQEGLLRCPVCSKGFMNNADLTAHIESHPKRSKSGQLSTKHPVPEPLKKSLKIQLTPHNKDLGAVKPKSLASALDPSSEKTTTKTKSFASALDPSIEKSTTKPKSFASALDPSSEKTTIKPKSFASALDPFSEKTTTKPKSFASALDPSSEKNTTKPKSFVSALDPSSEKMKEPMLVLKRNDGSTSTSKDDISKSLKTNKSVTNPGKPSKEQVKKPVPAVKHDKKEPKQVKAVDLKPKSDEKNSTREENKKKEENTSSECTCKECPECVTRFLQSFE